jgi:hypothetical protein
MDPGIRMELPLRQGFHGCAQRQECGTKGTISNQTIPEKEKVKEMPGCWKMLEDAGRCWKYLQR